MFERHSFFIVREWFAEQGPGGKTWACSLCGFGIGFWVERDWSHGPCYWVRIQGSNRYGYHCAVHYQTYIYNKHLIESLISIHVQQTTLRINFQNEWPIRCRQRDVIGRVRIVLPQVQIHLKKLLQIFIANNMLILSCLPLIKF